MANAESSWKPQPAGEVVHDRVGDRVVLIDAQGQELITLNPVGALVWQAMDGNRDIAAIAAMVHGAVDGGELDVVNRDVQAFIRELVAEGLVVEVH